MRWLSTFLTTKEQRVFRDDGSGNTVAVMGTGTDAVTYVLLHESTHVADFVCGMTKHPENGIWGGSLGQPEGYGAGAGGFDGGEDLLSWRAEGSGGAGGDVV